LFWKFQKTQFTTDTFTPYNMCNHYFFEKTDSYKKFLKDSKKLVIITDPPFGAKVELIWFGLQAMEKDWNSETKTDEKSAQKADKFWIFPYFMEGHILSKCCSQFQMSDYQINYVNHKKFKAQGATQKRSQNPTRFFTTVPLSQVKLENLSKPYKVCRICEKWVAANNSHCPICNSCTTKVRLLQCLMFLWNSARYDYGQ